MDKTDYLREIKCLLKAHNYDGKALTWLKVDPYHSSCHAVNPASEADRNQNLSGHLGVGPSKCQNWGFLQYLSYFYQWWLISPNSSPNLCDPWTAAPLSSVCQQILKQDTLHWLPFPSLPAFGLSLIFLEIENKITTELYCPNKSVNAKELWSLIFYICV